MTDRLAEIEAQHARALPIRHEDAEWLIEQVRATQLALAETRIGGIAGAVSDEDKKRAVAVFWKTVTADDATLPSSVGVIAALEDFAARSIETAGAPLEAEQAKYARQGAYAMLDLLSGLYPGFDRQALDAVFRAMQDKYGSSLGQVEIAARMALAEESSAWSGSVHKPLAHG